MTRETALSKADRLLTAGSLRVTSLYPEAEVVTAVARGDSAVYQLGHDVEKGGWWCTCEVRAPSLCSHLLALQRVTVPRKRPPGGSYED